MSIKNPRIKVHGAIPIPTSIWEHADSIKLENYKVNLPKKFQKHVQDTVDSERFLQTLSDMVGIAPEFLDYVYFSCSKGAEEHVDELSPTEFTSTTFVVPIILPLGKSTLKVNGDRMTIYENFVYEFNHETPHSLELWDKITGCVMLMVAAAKIPKRGEVCVYDDGQGFKVLLRPDGKYYAYGIGYGTFKGKDTLIEAKRNSSAYYHWSESMDSN